MASPKHFAIKSGDKAVGPQRVSIVFGVEVNADMYDSDAILENTPLEKPVSEASGKQGKKEQASNKYLILGVGAGGLIDNKYLMTANHIVTPKCDEIKWPKKKKGQYASLCKKYNTAGVLCYLGKGQNQQTYNCLYIKNLSPKVHRDAVIFTINQERNPEQKARLFPRLASLQNGQCVLNGEIFSKDNAETIHAYPNYNNKNQFTFVADLVQNKSKEFNLVAVNLQNQDCNIDETNNEAVLLNLQQDVIQNGHSGSILFKAVQNQIAIFGVLIQNGTNKRAKIQFFDSNPFDEVFETVESTNLSPKKHDTQPTEIGNAMLKDVSVSAALAYPMGMELPNGYAQKYRQNHPGVAFEGNIDFKSRNIVFNKALKIDWATFGLSFMYARFDTQPDVEKATSLTNFGLNHALTLHCTASFCLKRTDLALMPLSIGIDAYGRGPETTTSPGLRISYNPGVQLNFYIWNQLFLTLGYRAFIYSSPIHISHQWLSMGLGFNFDLK